MGNRSRRGVEPLGVDRRMPKKPNNRQTTVESRELIPGAWATLYACVLSASAAASTPAAAERATPAPAAATERGATPAAAAAPKATAAAAAAPAAAYPPLPPLPPPLPPPPPFCGRKRSMGSSLSGEMWNLSPLE